MNYKTIYINQSTIDKYKKLYKNLCHVKIGDDFKGIILLDKDEFVGIIQTNQKTKFIVALEVNPKYRNKGVATELIEYAENNLNVNKLSVNKKNTKALKLYKKLNYIIYNENEYMYFMRKEY